MRRTGLLLAVCLLLPLGGLGACGSGSGGGRGGFSSTLAGPAKLALPVFDDNTLKTLVLRNLLDTIAPVRVFSIPGGAVQTLNVPARGELRRTAGSFGVNTAGWLVVDTNDPVTGFPIATTGFVEPYLFTERSGPDVEAAYGAVLQSTESVIPVHPRTDRVSLLNFNAVPVTYTVCCFGATDGATSPLLSVVPVPVAANSFANLDFSPIQNQAGVGHISVLPPGAGLSYTLGAHQDEDIVLEVDDRVAGTSRLLDQGGTTNAELIVSFGKDPQSGGYEDFDVLVANGSDFASTFTVQSIHDESGNLVKGTPRTFQMPARQSRLFATTLVDSLGLQVGETHPFAEHFGDVFLSSDRRFFRMNLSIGAGLFVSSLEFDPLTLEFASRVRPTAVRRSTSMFVTDAQTSWLTGIENFGYLSNPSNGLITLQVRAFTKDLGTEYLLGSFDVPPQSITPFRFDALHLKETPGVAIQPDVSHLRFLFTSNSPFGIRGRQAGRDVNDLLVFTTPLTLRYEE